MRFVIDTTSAAIRPMNTGIQRVVRGVTAALRKRHPVLPILWDEELGGYRNLLPHEETWLHTPQPEFPTWTPPALHPMLRRKRDKRSLPQRRANARPLLDFLADSDLFLVPEVFRDGRLGVFEQARERCRSTRWVSFFYDATPLKLREITDPARRRALDEYHRNLAQFDLVIAASEETRTDIESLWHDLQLPPARTTVMPWPIPFETPRPILTPNFDAKHLLYVATLEGRKNHLTLLAAAETLWADGESFTLELIGRTTRHWGPKVIPEIHRLKKQRSPLIWRGQVDDASLTDAYRRASATVFPSLMEGYGIPILESLFFHRPCLCRADGAIGEVSRGGGCLHADVESPTSLAAAMRALLHDKALYERLYHEARERTFPQWDPFVDQLCEHADTLPPSPHNR